MCNQIDARVTAHHHQQQDAEVGRIMETFQPHLIIDDAGHDHQHEMICYQRCWPHLRPGGLYIIEDIQNPEYHADWQALGATIKAGYTSSMNGAYSYDDVLAVMRKGQV